MRSLVVALLSLALLLPGQVRGQEPEIDPSFSNQLLSAAGLPEIAIVQSEAGFTAPREVAAGRYLVSLTSLPGWSAYLALVQPPTRAPGDRSRRATSLRGAL